MKMEIGLMGESQMDSQCLEWLEKLGIGMKKLQLGQTLLSFWNEAFLWFLSIDLYFTSFSSSSNILPGLKKRGLSNEGFFRKLKSYYFNNLSALFGVKKHGLSIEGSFRKLKISSILLVECSSIEDILGLFFFFIIDFTSALWLFSLFLLRLSNLFIWFLRIRTSFIMTGK